jgi:hypothetical protein
MKIKLEETKSQAKGLLGKDLKPNVLYRCVETPYKTFHESLGICEGDIVLKPEVCTDIEPDTILIHFNPRRNLIHLFKDSSDKIQYELLADGKELNISPI